MTKKTILALLLILALTVSGFAFAEAAQPEATPAPAQAEAPEDNFSYDALASETVLASVNGKEILKANIEDIYAYYGQQFTQYGMDLTQPAYQRLLLNYVLNMVVQSELISQKAAEMGMDTFTDEETEAFRTQAQGNYDAMFAMYKGYLAAEGKTDEQVSQEVTDLLVSNGYTVDKLVENAKTTEVFNRVNEYFTKDVTVDDKAVEEAYKAGVESAKASYEADKNAYETTRNSGGVVYYTPEGFRYVKHILVKSDNAAEIKSLTAELAQMAQDDPKHAETEAKIAELKADVQPKLDEIAAKIAAGEDFQTLIDTYGEDGGMKAGAANAETGYLMCETTATYVPEFTQGGMALEKVGDISEPILTNYGYHIIRYESDLPAGEAPFEEIREAVKAELLTAAQNQAFAQGVQGWAQDADIQYTTF